MKRLVLSGVESVGKSRLAAELAQHFGGSLVPEYGRGYTESLDRPLSLQDHHAIAEGHARNADAVAATAPILLPVLLIEDTDIVMTTAWASMLFGGRDATLAGRASRADRHLLLLPDVPFVADPVRMFGTPEQRLRFHAIVAGEFRLRGLGFVPIGGDWATRRTKAFAAVQELLA